MIKLENRTLSARSLMWLRNWQKQVDDEVDFPSQLEKADRMWNKGSTVTFREIKQILTEMCCGACRCCYCSDSLADEIEHISPKNIYPNQCFVWENYLFSCGPCNVAKSNKFAIFDINTGEVIDITPPKRKPQNYIPQPPLDGQPVFINPQDDDPKDFLQLDILGTENK